MISTAYLKHFSSDFYNVNLKFFYRKGVLIILSETNQAWDRYYLSFAESLQHAGYIMSCETKEDKVSRFKSSIANINTALPVT